MEEGDVALCQRKSRSPLQWPAIDENGHLGGQKHEEDFYREESNVMEHISRNHMQPSQLSGKSYFICKTELLVISAKHLPRPIFQELSGANETIRPSLNARNSGVIFDNHLHFNAHIQSVCESSFYHLHSISYIRECQSSSTTEILVHGLYLQNWIIAILYSMAYRTIKLKSYSTSRGMPLLVSSLFQENMNTLHLFC